MSNPATGWRTGPVVDLRCPQCQIRLRVPETDLHKQIRCPACRTAFRVNEGEKSGVGASTPPLIAQLSAAATTEPVSLASPNNLTSTDASLPATADSHAPALAAPSPTTSAPAPTPAPSPSHEPGGQWYVKTTEGEQYGPVSQDELKQWVNEGRLDEQCQVLRVGWKQWQWADEAFPVLASALSDANSSTARATRPKRPEPEMVVDEFGIPHAAPDDPFAAGVNPFEIADAGPTEVPEELPNEAGITESMRHAIAESRPWVTVLAVLGALAGVGSIWYGATILKWAIVLSKVPLMFMGTSFALCGGLSLWATYRLWNLSREMLWFQRNEGTRTLQAVLVAQRTFWQLAGIVAVTAAVLATLTAILISTFGAPVRMF